MIHSLDVTIHSRSRGHSAAAAVAYRCGLDLRCSRSAEQHRYAHRKEDVIAADIVGGIWGGKGDKPEARYQAWADSIEAGEKRRNSQLLRDVQVALPVELTREEQVVLADQWAAKLATHYSTSILYAVHRPPKEGDQRNFHMHALLPTRELVGGGSFVGGKKIRTINRDALTAWHLQWDAMQTDALAQVEVAPEPRAHGERLGRLARSVVWAERRAARKKDLARAKDAGREHVPVPRSVQQLLHYTGGTTTDGMYWLRRWLRLRLDAAQQQLRSLSAQRQHAQEAVLTQASELLARLDYAFAMFNRNQNSTAAARPSHSAPTRPAPATEPDTQSPGTGLRRAAGDLANSYQTNETNEDGPVEDGSGAAPSA